MKTIKLPTLILGAVLFLSVGATTASAEAMKCGAGKCGSEMKTPKAKKENMKCGAGKCGSEMKTPESSDDKKWGKKYYEKERPRGEIKTH
ncbi:hypothetical protein HUE87_00700 [Candidatus Sulfurimonas marisnigri]|uniref:Periplasmic protein n=1 Tax=Candidatus Sulfurimonas marisnigri TaxID=2740405 RepID=A0A7S7M0H3_9BACT|nr:hypothetical protein [Candidatus Sulfurimonas marisnigri]QOY54802.1 hypothetical protein HUE87_00700 [Candidatus Sulfurimonas marisnigri]